MKTRITVKSNSALALEGDFEIVDKDGKAYNLAGRGVVSLCRCGLSKNKPFCDGSHTAVGFTASGEAAPKEVMKPLPARNGGVTVDPVFCRHRG